jgi:hypothetical protein
MRKQVQLVPREIRESGFPTASLLSEQEQRKYENAIRKFDSEKARNSLNVPIEGSNLWKILLLNQIGIRTATIPELECAFENDMNLKGTYEDGREVILRSVGDSYQPNDFIARDLAEKLKIKRLSGNPLIVTGLNPIENTSSEYGLVLDSTTATQVIEAPDFSHKNNQRKFLRINPDYTIEWSDKGRTFYSRGNGLSRLGLGRDLGLDSDWDSLSGSGSDGRVVVIDAEGVA